MSEPIVFVSHFKMKEGKLDAYRELQQDIAAAIEREKPGTGVFLAFLDPGGTDATVIHVFRDATAMDAHFEGSERRSKAASEVMVPAGWELYGSPSNAVIENIRQAVASSGVSLALAPDYVAGYVRSA